jgi:hypothetical protein
MCNSYTGERCGLVLLYAGRPKGGPEDNPLKLIFQLDIWREIVDSLKIRIYSYLGEGSGFG